MVALHRHLPINAAGLGSYLSRLQERLLHFSLLLKWIVMQNRDFTSAHFKANAWQSFHIAVVIWYAELIPYPKTILCARLTWVWTSDRITCHSRFTFCFINDRFGRRYSEFMAHNAIMLNSPVWCLNSRRLSQNAITTFSHFTSHQLGFNVSQFIFYRDVFWSKAAW